LRCLIKNPFQTFLRKRKPPGKKGWTVELGRDWLDYCVKGRHMSITVDSGIKEVTIYSDSIGRWNDTPDKRVDEQERLSILQNIVKHLEDNGYIAKVE
jgi:hypothetical protein